MSSLFLENVSIVKKYKYFKSFICSFGITPKEPKTLATTSVSLILILCNYTKKLRPHLKKT